MKVSSLPELIGPTFFMASAVFSTASNFFYEKIRLKGFVVFCAAGSLMIFSALISGFDKKIFGAAFILLMISGFLALFLGDRVDQDTEEKTISIRKFW